MFAKTTVNQSQSATLPVNQDGAASGAAPTMSRSQTIVVRMTVPMSDRCEGMTTPFCRSTSSATASRNELAMAAISLHALMRHQNQRSR